MRVFKRINVKKTCWIAFFCIVLSCCVYFFSAHFFELAAYDFMTRLSANKTGSDSIVNIVIDEESIEEISAWPWKRTLYTDMFEYLNKKGAKAVVFDAVLKDTADAKDDEEFLKRVEKIPSLFAGVEFSKNENLKNDADEIEYFAKKFSINVKDNRNKKDRDKSAYTAYEKILDGYLNSLKYIGSVNTALDTDGAVRAFEPFILLNGKYYPSLPMTVYSVLSGVKEISLYDDGYDVIFEDNTIKHFPVRYYGDKSVQYIKWLSPYDKTSWIPHGQIKASDVIKSARLQAEGIAPIVPDEKIKDKIIVIGATANALYDLKITPVSINMPGSTIQATILDNLFSNDSIRVASAWCNIVIMLLFMCIIFVLVYFLAPLLSITGILILGFIYFYLTLFAYSEGFAINVVTPYLFFIITAMAAFSYKSFVEDSKKEKLKRAMKQYINTSVVDNIIHEDDEVKLGGQKTELTILMADIRGFTRFSENLDPDEVTKLLNEYFGLMLPIIEEYGGVVNKFIGDAILAVFNEPVKDKMHPLKAILCATKMLAALKDLKKKWKSENKPDIGISIGINTGMAFIGNIGTPNHLEYTVIGDTVNVASRIEAQNRQFNTQLLISESTYECVKDFVDVIKISSVEIRGREKHMNIYEIIKILDNNEIN